LLILVLVCVLLISCANDPALSDEPPKDSDLHHKIVFSLFNDNNPWPIALAKDLESAAKENSIEFILLNAKGDPQKQYDHIRQLEAEEVDMLLLSAVDKEIGGDCLQLCKQKDIPVILVARNADGIMGQDYITLIAHDYELVGYSQGMSLIRAFRDRPCRVVELAGDPGASNTVSLSNGFRRALEYDKNFSIVATESTTTSTREAQEVMEGIIQSQIKFDAIFCHSDADALGAIQALKTAGLTPGCDPKQGHILITSNCGYEDAIKAVAIEDLYNTFDLNARLGDLVIKTTKQYWNGEFIIPRIQVTYSEINSQNVNTVLGQGY